MSPDDHRDHGDESSHNPAGVPLLRPTTIELHYETTTSFVVDLENEKWKHGDDDGDLRDVDYWVAFREGEYVGEGWYDGGFVVNGDDEDLEGAARKAMAIFDKGAKTKAPEELPSIHDLFDKVRQHPDFRFGTIFVDADIPENLILGETSKKYATERITAEGFDYLNLYARWIEEEN